MKRLTKCVNCGGNLQFDPQKNMLHCDHCDSFFNINLPSKNVKLVRKYTIDYTPDNSSILDSQYLCTTCNSVHTVQDGKVSTRCPSCGATTVVKNSSETNYPDGIIPFKLSKDNAAEIFEKWITSRKFAPTDLKVMARGKKISSVYVPVYNLNGVCNNTYSATVKKVHTDSSTDTIFSTVHTLRDIEVVPIKNYTVIANSVVEKSLLNKIVSVDPSEIIPYSPDYLFGYSGADTNISIHEAVDALKKQSHESGENLIRHKLKEKYDEIVHLNVESSLRNLSFSHAYVPVFMNHYNYKGKHYHCYISGTSGKVVGKSPKSAGKIFAIIGGALALAGIVALCISLFI